MDDINSAISSILGDPAKMEQLRSVAQSLGMNPGGGAPPGQNQPNASGGNGGGGGGFDPAAIASMAQTLQGIMGGGGANNAGAAPQGSGTAQSGGMPNMDSISKIAGIMGTFNQSDKNVELLRSLKPHFSPTRAGRIDDAVRIMQLIRAWPSLRDSGILGSLGNLGNLFGGGPR